MLLADHDTELTQDHSGRKYTYNSGRKAVGGKRRVAIPEVVVATDRVYDPWQKVFLCSIDWRKNP